MGRHEPSNSSRGSPRQAGLGPLSAERTGFLRRWVAEVSTKGYYADTASSSSVIFTRLGSTRIPGPIVEARVTDLK